MTLTLTITSAQSQSLGSDSCREFGATGGSIGRVAGNDWVLPDPERFVSSQHAVIKFQDGDFYLTDTSTNGTFLNSGDTPVGNGVSVKLNEGDVVRIGDYDMQVNIVDADAIPAAPAGPAADPFATPGSQPVFESAVDSGPTLDPLASLDSATSSPMLDNTGPAGADPFNTPAGSLEQEYTGPTGGAYVPPPVHSDAPIPEDWDKTSYEAPASPEPFAAPPADISQPGMPGMQQDMHQESPITDIPEDWDKTSFSAPASPEPYVGPGADISQPGTVPPPPPGIVPPAVPDPMALDPMALDPAASAGDTVQRPALQPGATPPAPGAAAPAGSGDLVQLLLNAGMDEATARQTASPEMAALIGRLLPIFVSGMVDILTARTEIKSQFRMSMTRMQPVENNPLKFCANAQDAFAHLFVEQGRSFLPADQAFTEGFEDIKAHQMAMLAGMRAAYDSMIDNLDPARMQKKFDHELRRSPMLKTLNKTKYWDMYGEMFDDVNRDADESFRRLFGDAFVKAYEDQMARLQTMRRR